LADYTLGLKTAALSDATLASVRDCVLDCVTAAIAGAPADGSRAARVTARTSFGSGPSSVWFSATKVPASAAGSGATGDSQETSNISSEPQRPSSLSQ